MQLISMIDLLTTTSKEADDRTVSSEISVVPQMWLAADNPRATAGHVILLARYQKCSA